MHGCLVRSLREPLVRGTTQACVCYPPGWLEARDENCPVHGREALPGFWDEHDETEEIIARTDARDDD
jgi:hypothetical protein